MSIKEIASHIKEPDMYNFEKRLREALHELSLKRGLLEESRKDLNQALLVKYDLERRLDRACRELEESQVQLELAVSAGRKWEEEREAVPLHRAQLQAAVTERDALKEQARTLQFENVELKRKVEELEGQVHCLSSFQNGTIALQTKVEEFIREVKRQSQCLSQDHKRLERSVKAAASIGARLELTVRHNNCIQERMKDQQRKMEAKTIALSTELEKVKSDSPSADHDSSKKEAQGIHFDEWKKSINEMENRLKSSEECRMKLQKTLDSAIKMSVRFEKESKALKEENSQLMQLKQAAESHLQELIDKPPKRDIPTKDEEVQVSCPSVEIPTPDYANVTSSSIEQLQCYRAEEKKMEE
ncbi:myosin-2 heavy chain-like isoform X2 [Ischnura elegans]|nr:myosin-2 heavy chain-like isoform X2 [Ischnura elegans]